MKSRWLAIFVVAMLLLGGAVIIINFWRDLTLPVRTASHFPWKMLIEEATVIDNCMSCHEPEKFHTCDSCHDDHGAVEMTNVPFDDLILLQGDVPEPGYIAVNDILPYREQPQTSIRLLDFLLQQGASEFESVTLSSRDGGWITINHKELTENAVLLPHIDGVRFASEDLHVSTWLKGVWRIIIVGIEKPLILDGYHTSIGRLLLGPTSSVTIEQTDVALRSESDSQIRKAKTASRIEGVAVVNIVENPDSDNLTVRDAEGMFYTLSRAEARTAVLTQMGNEIVIVLPNHGRSMWIKNIVEIISEE